MLAQPTDRLQRVESLRQTVEVRAGSERPRLYKNLDGHVRFFGAPLGKAAELPAAVRSATLPADQAIGFVREHAAAFGVRSATADFVPARVHARPGRSFVRLNQTYAGLPVFGAQTVVQVGNVRGGVEAVMNDLMTRTEKLDGGEISLQPALTAAAAESAALAIVAATPLLKFASEVAFSTHYLVLWREPVLSIFDPAVVSEEGDPILVWDMEVCDILSLYPELIGSVTLPGPLAEKILVDAQTGAPAFRYSLIQGSGGCHDDTTGLHRHIYDYNGSNDPPGGPPARDEGGSPIYQDPPTANAHDVDLAYCHAGEAFNMFYLISGNEWLGYDGTGFDDSKPLTVGVKIDVLDGYWHPVQQRILVGPGWATDDIVAHEYAHFVTQQVSGLIFHGESGAINESFSDVFGELVDLYNGYDSSGNYDDPADRWLIAEDALFPYWQNYVARRNMANPPSNGGGDPIVKHPGPDHYDDTSYGDDIYARCGISNKLAYLLAEGGTVWPFTIHPLDDSYVVTSLGYTARLYFECQFLLTSACNYQDLYFAMQQAGRNMVDLQIIDEEQLEDIDNACKAVGIHQTVLWVDINASGAEDGSSPLDAFTSIQDAVNAAEAGDDIVVMQGVYYENVSFDGAEEGIGALRSVNPYNWEIVTTTVIDGGGNAPTIVIGGHSPAYILGFTIRNGNYDIFEGYGGGVHAIEGNSAILIGYNYFLNNTAAFGGAIGGGVGGVVVNNVFHGNTASYGGGALYGCSGMIVWNTFYGNEVTESGGGGGALAGCYGQNSLILNNIFWNNKYDGETSDAYSTFYNCSSPIHCCIQNWSSGGTGNINGDPLLIDPDNGDFHIPINSPCRDAGLKFEGYFYFDMDGQYRGNDAVRSYYTFGLRNAGKHTGSESDIGADEYAWLTD